MTKQKFSGINFLGFGLGRSKLAFRKEDFDFYAKNSQVHGILRGLSGSFRIIERHFRDGLANREIGTNGSTNINLKDRRVVQIEYENTTAPSEEARGRCHVKKIRVLEPPPSAPRPLALADEPPPPAPMSTKVSVSTSFLKELSELYALANDPKGNVRLSAQRTNAFFDAFFEAAGNHGHGDHKANFGITYARKNA
ncbi:MAG: hypothetical protein LBF25_00630, partial [Puniceicoccales bacterium]|nr:hypothetical protein [Puniceicoccales bacterium]